MGRLSLKQLFASMTLLAIGSGTMLAFVRDKNPLLLLACMAYGAGIGVLARRPLLGALLGLIIGGVTLYVVVLFVTLFRYWLKY